MRTIRGLYWDHLGRDPIRMRHLPGKLSIGGLLRGDAFPYGIYVFVADEGQQVPIRRRMLLRKQAAAAAIVVDGVSYHLTRHITR